MSTTSTEQSDGVHRLKDMLVEEVSLVDRAANKRRFALVKRSSEQMKRVVPDGRGGYTLAKADDGSEDDEETKKAKGKAEGFPFGGGDADEEGKPGDDEEDDEDEEKSKSKKAEDEEDEDEDAEKGAKGKAAPPPFGGNKAPPFGGKPAGGKPGDDEEEDDEEKKAAPAKKALAVLTPALQKLVGVAKDLRDKGTCNKADFESAVNALGGMLGGKVEKRGARMAKERLQRFQKAIDMLGQILKELIEAKREAEGGFGEKSKTKKSDDRVAELEAEIGRLRKAVGAPNSGGAGEGRTPARKSDDANFAWPMDMNEKVSKKDLSFAE